MNQEKFKKGEIKNKKVFQKQILKFLTLKTSFVIIFKLGMVRNRATIRKTEK